MLKFRQYLEEKLIMYGQGKRYGQIVFLAGGAGSGKGFAISNFMEKEKFKIRDVDEWKKQGTHQYLIVFHFNNVPNKNYGFSYYIDTIMDDHWGKYENGLCLYGHKYDYASVSGEVMRKVEKFISEFVKVNGLNLHKEEN